MMSYTRLSGTDISKESITECEVSMSIDDSINEMTALFSKLKIRVDNQEETKIEIDSPFDDSEVKFVFGFESSVKYNIPQGEISDFVEFETNSFSQVQPKHELTIPKTKSSKTNHKAVLNKKSASARIVSVVNEINTSLKNSNIANIENVRFVIHKNLKNKYNRIKTSSIIEDLRTQTDLNDNRYFIQSM